MNNTMGEESLGTLLMDDLGDGEDNSRLWWAGADHANYTFLSTDITNEFNQITQAAISETMTSQSGLEIHASGQDVPPTWSHTQHPSSHCWTLVDWNG